MQSIISKKNLSFIYTGGIETFPNKQKLKASHTTHPFLQMMFKDVIHTGIKSENHHKEQLQR